MPKSIMFETIALAMDAAEFNQRDVWTDEEHLALLRRYMSLLLRQERELDVTDFLPAMLSIAILLEDKYSESHVETRTLGIISTVLSIASPRTHDVFRKEEK